MNELDLTIEVNAKLEIIHEALERFAIALWHNHKLQINRISYDWIIMTTLDDEQHLFIKSVDTDIRSYRNDPQPN